jgi:multiple sugar transport system ATP-binding protein
MAEVILENVSKVFTGGVRAVCDASLTVQDKEFVVLVGPSGCGKTTLLRLIAGLEAPTDGKIYIDGRLVNDVAPKDRDVAMVFQNYALYPHMTVYENMAFGLRNRGYSKAEMRSRVQETAEMLDITRLLDRKPKALSGGERQRVAVGRAIVRKPKVFLLDEPLSNLDAKLRTSARAEVEQFQKRIGTTTIYVTHDQVEAMAMGDRVVVMDKGRVRQIGTPAEVYDEPADTFVATFLGSPPMNLVSGAGTITGFRPEHFLPALAVADPDSVAMRLTFSHEEYLGAERILYGALAEGPFSGATAVSRIASTHAGLFAKGVTYDFSVEKRHLKTFDAATGRRRK